MASSIGKYMRRWEGMGKRLGGSLALPETR